MEIFIASRIAEGNIFFPTKIAIDKLGVTINEPELFTGKEEWIPFSMIFSVDIHCPFIGYSTIIIETTCKSKIRAHGFRKGKVKRIKELILDNTGD